MDLSIAGPLHCISLSGKQHNLLYRHLSFQTVKIIKGIPVTGGFQQFKLIFPGTDPGFLKKFPGNGLAAGLPSLGGTSGILPCAGKGFSFGPAGQKELATSVIYPNTYNQTVFAGMPGGSPSVDTPGQFAVFIVDIIEFQISLLLSTFSKYSLAYGYPKGNTDSQYVLPPYQSSEEKETRRILGAFQICYGFFSQPA